jgi:hypothetical protein
LDVEIKESVKQALSAAEALALCEQYGHRITYMGLKWAGLQYGFIFRSFAQCSKDNFSHLKFRREGLVEYLNKVTEKPLGGWLPIYDAMKKAKRRIGMVTVYRWIWSGKLRVKQYGAGRGRMHVNFKEFEKTLDEFYMGGNNARKK